MNERCAMRHGLAEQGSVRHLMQLTQEQQASEGVSH